MIYTKVLNAMNEDELRNYIDYFDEVEAAHKNLIRAKDEVIESLVILLDKKISEEESLATHDGILARFRDFENNLIRKHKDVLSVPPREKKMIEVKEIDHDRQGNN